MYGKMVVLRFWCLLPKPLPTPLQEIKEIRFVIGVDICKTFLCVMRLVRIWEGSGTTLRECEQIGGDCHGKGPYLDNPWSITHVGSLSKNGTSCNKALLLLGSATLKITPYVDTSMRALHNSYSLKEGGFFFSSKALGLVFSATYPWGSFAPSALPR